jgi:hypothetical protein
MRFQRIAAALCAIAGVFVLAGFGWSLVAAAVLLFVSPAPAQLPVFGRKLRAAVLAGWHWLTTGRRAVAVASMPLAVLLLPLGVGLVAGVGWAVVSGAVSLAGVSLLTGQNA